ncbi:hypothetical protein H6P81_010989 [Aristolochia fimbriata]|uniref:Uncharacterized protein n=1 Tax=Aristolochia fimbriata TaxID=158543 RepID=A0AAV7ER02_ARIFI|nr:hypothetical protein H6P81_010989 [Aristolochia fimbriata]
MGTDNFVILSQEKTLTGGLPWPMGGSWMDFQPFSHRGEAGRVVVLLSVLNLDFGSFLQSPNWRKSPRPLAMNVPYLAATELVASPFRAVCPGTNGLTPCGSSYTVLQVKFCFHCCYIG